MNRKYLAYIALLAGWVVLCYWLYANGIAPRFHERRETSHLEFVEDLPYPLAFRWGSAVPVTGPGYEAWLKEYSRPDSLGEIWALRGHYFRDEADSSALLTALAQDRIRVALQLLRPDMEYVVTGITSQEINADVRSNPFESVSIERIPIGDMMFIRGDTLEVCFPLPDSLHLPGVIQRRVREWCEEQITRSIGLPHITGTADGSGIAESTDEALDRALVIQSLLIECGWTEDQILLTTGQRNHPLTLHNRCVIVYFE